MQNLAAKIDIQKGHEDDFVADNSHFQVQRLGVHLESVALCPSARRVGITPSLLAHQD